MQIAVLCHFQCTFLGRPFKTVLSALNFFMVRLTIDVFRSISSNEICQRFWIQLIIDDYSQGPNLVESYDLFFIWHA